MIKAIIKEFRIKQYTKNLLVYAAALFSGTLLDKQTFLVVTATFIAFSLMASFVYILNDIMDVEKDRQHPEKCKRPIASGKISIQWAVFLAVLLLILSIAISLYINKNLTFILLIYLIMNLLYSIKLKHIVIIDVMVIAFGFVLRAMSGVAVIDVGITTWFILCIFMLSLFLALAKRRAEIELFINEQKKQRKVLKEYSLKLIDQLLVVVTAMVLTSYSLFALQATQDHLLYSLNIPFMMLTIPLVVYAVFRYLYLIYIKGMGGSPDEVLVHDRYMSATITIYIFIIIIVRNV